MTLGGRLVAQYLKKKVRAPNTEWLNGERLGGLKRIRGTDLNRISKCARTVNRPYGGTLTSSALKDRIIHAFISEEVKEVKVQLAHAASEEKQKAPVKKTKKQGQQGAPTKKR